MCIRDRAHIQVLAESAGTAEIRLPEPKQSGMLPLATEKVPALLPVDVQCGTVLCCDEAVGEAIEAAEERAEPVTAIRIEKEEQLENFADNQYAVSYTHLIRDNISYGYNALTGTEATEEEIIAAAKMAYVDHFVQTLPAGYDTVINDDATNISQGQKQLMTIARAFLSNPSILILDEATSSVDTRTEVLIQKAMQKLMEGRTSFVIAHRLSTIRDADLILVMNHGTIIEQGSHQELLDKKGFYYDLYNSQFIGATVEEEPAAQPTGFSGFPGGFPGGKFPGKQGAHT